MGIDLLQLHLSLEQHLGIVIPNDDLGGLWNARGDIQVRDLADALDRIVQRENPSFSGNVGLVTIDSVSKFTGIERSQISLDSWFVRDLGLS